MEPESKQLTYEDLSDADKRLADVHGVPYALEKARLKQERSKAQEAN